MSDTSPKKEHRDPPIPLTHAEYRAQFCVPPVAPAPAPSTDGAESNDATQEKQKADRALLEAALEQARDARKFEIEMYWKRATYFWAFIAAAFVGYAAFFNYRHAFAAFLMSMIGLVFSHAWYLANRGSKFWQENWENHVELLEDSVTGPLYKTIAQRPIPQKKEDQTFDDRWIGPLPLSVSKINGVVSMFVILIWAELALAASSTALYPDWHTVIDAWPWYGLLAARLVVLLGLILPAALAWRWFKRYVESHQGGHHSRLAVRQVIPDDPSSYVKAPADPAPEEPSHA